MIAVFNQVSKNQNQPIITEVYTIISQMRTQSKNNKLLEARENANGFSFASNWSGGWCEVSGPITEYS